MNIFSKRFEALVNFYLVAVDWALKTYRCATCWDPMVSGSGGDFQLAVSALELSVALVLVRCCVASLHLSYGTSLLLSYATLQIV